MEDEEKKEKNRIKAKWMQDVTNLNGNIKKKNKFVWKTK